MDIALREAIKRSGGGAALAEKLTARGEKISKSAVSQWRRCPPKRVLAVESISGVPRHELRPDLYPQETAR